MVINPRYLPKYYSIVVHYQTKDELCRKISEVKYICLHYIEYIMSQFSAYLLKFNEINVS